MVGWLFFFMAWSAYYLAVKTQEMALTAERRAADAESAAQAAQLRALRYQVNPPLPVQHAELLVVAGDDRAQRSRRGDAAGAVHLLSSSLSLDPAADISLAQEIDLQRLYLEIEKTRFPDRLQVEIEVPDALQSARLPALILQPIVENAIKYGVSKTRHKVLIRIVCEALDGGRMAITISNRLLNGKKNELPAATHEGTGLGLSNVSERLETRFGGKADCRRHGPMTGGGYKVVLTMPVQAMAEETLRVLIADDEPLAAERLQVLLARTSGATLVGTASDGESAVSMAEALSPDLLLLDIAMPGLDGIDVARSLAARLRALRSSS